MSAFTTSTAKSQQEKLLQYLTLVLLEHADNYLTIYITGTDIQRTTT